MNLKQTFFRLRADFSEMVSRLGSSSVEYFSYRKLLDRNTGLVRFEPKTDSPTDVRTRIFGTDPATHRKLVNCGRGRVQYARFGFFVDSGHELSEFLFFAAVAAAANDDDDVDDASFFDQLSFGWNVSFKFVCDNVLNSS